MRIQIGWNERRWEVDTAAGREIAIRQTFDEAQPNHFGAPPARCAPLRAGDFVGSVAGGGSCNVATIQMIPHCNGTHTESIHHILPTAPPIPGPHPPVWMLARLLTVRPEQGEDHGEGYQPPLLSGDRVVTARRLQAAWSSQPAAAAAPFSSSTLGGAASRDSARSSDPGGLSHDWPLGLIVRTLPNDPGKRTARYGGPNEPCFFTSEAIDWIAARFEHLLVDFPSLDRTHDEGLLSNHHRFWRIPPGPQPSLSAAAWRRTVTEMIFVADDLVDDWYLLNLQVAAWESDAVPSRPLVFRLRQVDSPAALR